MSANRGPWLHALTYFPLGLNSYTVSAFHYVSDEKVIINGIAFISVSQNMAGKNHLRVIGKNTDSGLRLLFPRGEAWESLFKKQTPLVFLSGKFGKHLHFPSFPYCTHEGDMKLSDKIHTPFSQLCHTAKETMQFLLIIHKWLSPISPWSHKLLSVPFPSELLMTL